MKTGRFFIEDKSIECPCAPMTSKNTVDIAAGSGKVWMCQLLWPAGRVVVDCRKHWEDLIDRNKIYETNT